MLQIIDSRREHIKLQLSYKTAQTSNGHSSSNNGAHHRGEEDDDDDGNTSSTHDEKPVDYTLYPEYSLTYFLFFLSKSPAFILYDDIEMLHTMTDYILFLLDALLLRCDTTVGLFYKGLLRSIKSSEDATISSEKEEKAERKDALKKLHVLVDLAYVILSQRASSLMICRASSNVPLPEMYFKKSRYNHLSYLPKDFKIKLKPITTTTVTDLATATAAATRRVNVSNNAETMNNNVSTASSITITKRTRKKRTSEDNDEETPTKKQRTSTIKKRRKRQISNHTDDDDDEQVEEDEEEDDDDEEEENNDKSSKSGEKKKSSSSFLVVLYHEFEYPYLQVFDHYRCSY